MIEITIRKLSTETKMETKNFIVRKTPTDKTGKPNVYEDVKPLFDETYETREVPVERSVETLLLKQNIEDDSQFDLGAVIKALNKI